MPSVLLAPLFSISAPLLQTLSTSYSYLATGGELLHDTIALDAHLQSAVVATPTENGTDIFLDCHRIDLNAARRLFLEIRGHREKIDAEYPLLAPAAGLLDHISHTVTNILPMTEIRPRKIVSVSQDGASFSFENVEKRGFVWSLAVHFGISPDPLFGASFDLQNKNTGRALGQFGLGVYTYLGYAFVPALGSVQCLSPEIAREWARRRIAPASIQRSPDGSYFLDPDKREQ